MTATWPSEMKLPANSQMTFPIELRTFRVDEALVRPIFDNFDDVDTSESCYLDFFRTAEMLVVPSIRSGVSRHPLNRSSQLMFLDFSYLVYSGLRFLKNGSTVLLGKEVPQELCFHFGGTNVDIDSEFLELSISCESAYIHPVPDARLTNDQWTPMESWISTAEIEAFRRGERMPDLIRKLLDDNRHLAIR